MLKSHEKTFGLFQKFIDLLVVGMAWYTSYLIRFKYLPGGQEGLGELFLQLSPLVGALTLYFFYRAGLYKSQRFHSRAREVLTVFQANFQALLAVIIVLYFIAPERISRLMLLIYFATSQVMLVTVRLLVRNFLRVLRRKGYNLRHVLLVGNGDQLANYVETTKLFKDAGINIIGWIDSRGKAMEYGITALAETLEEAKTKYHPDVIVVGYSGPESNLVEEILKDAYNDVTPIQVLPALTYSFIGHQVEDFGGIPLLSVNQPKLSSFDHFLKRAFDFTASFIGLLIISPLLLILAIAVKLTSKGPIFYGQKRMGLNGKNFTMWKFRSMKVDVENKPGWTVENDPRRTPIGKLLRSTSMDELPQIWNVLVGDMSLVGPRPEQPFFVEKFRKEIPAYMLRHKMKAGITGWAQVNGWRGDTSLEKRIECDIYYIKHWSLWLDIKILFLTFWKGLINKNAY